jgi:hypothetical protein
MTRRKDVAETPFLPAGGSKYANLRYSFGRKKDSEQWNRFEHEGRVKIRPWCRRGPPERRRWRWCLGASSRRSARTGTSTESLRYGDPAKTPAKQRTAEYWARARRRLWRRPVTGDCEASTRKAGACEWTARPSQRRAKQRGRALSSSTAASRPEARVSYNPRLGDVA